jgi:hypothetical protein
MGAIFQTISIILSLIPALITAIKAIEEAIPGEGKGEQKLAAIRQIIEVVYGQVFSLWPTLEKVISVLVGVFNTTGVFKTSSKM